MCYKIKKRKEKEKSNNALLADGHVFFWGGYTGLGYWLLSWKKYDKDSLVPELICWKWVSVIGAGKET